MITIKGYAKINLALNVCGTDGDYHLLDTLMQSINLYDNVTLSSRKDGKFISNIDNDNTIKVVAAISNAFCLGGIEIYIQKNIPFSGGLGGSSADSAAAVVGLCKLFDIDYTKATNIAIPMFSDLAFQLKGGTARCSKRGNVVDNLPNLPVMYVLIAPCKYGVSTKDAFALCDNLPKVKFANIDLLYNSLLNYNCAQVYHANHLTDAAIQLNEEIKEKLIFMADSNSLLSAMSGSGSAVFNLYANENDAKSKAASLPFYTILTTTTNQYN